MTRVSYPITKFPVCGRYVVNHSDLPHEISSIGEKLSPKVVVLGEAAVGKSCLVARVCDNTFSGSYIATVGAQYASACCVLNSVSLPVQVWDIAGSDDYRNMAKLYFRGCHVALMCFDLSRDDTLPALNNWCDLLESNVPDIYAKFLVGCKSDIKQAMCDEEVEQFAKARGLEYFTTSAKDKFGTEDLAQRALYLACLAANEKKKTTGAQPLPVVLSSESPVQTKSTTSCCK